jgi:hypothetical protein
MDRSLKRDCFQGETHLSGVALHQLMLNRYS